MTDSISTSKKGNRPIASLMTKEVVTCQITQSIADAAKLLVDHGVGGLPVVDEQGVCVGILTATDIVRFEVERLVNDDTNNFGLEADVTQDETGAWRVGIEPLDRVQRFMNAAVQTIDESASVEKAAMAMWHGKIHHLVVLDAHGRPIGMVSSLDLLCFDCDSLSGTSSITSIKI